MNNIEEKIEENMSNSNNINLLSTKNNNFINLKEMPDDNVNNLIQKLENNELEIKLSAIHYLNNYKIQKYYDYTNKFGVVYFVSSDNNFMCICYNDYSNLVKNLSLSLVEPKNKLVYNYFDKDHKNPLNFDELGFDAYLKNKNSNKELSKKIEIFKQILHKYSNDIAAMKPLYGNNEFLNYNISKVVIVKDFMKVQQAILFRLSNKLVQVIFVDQSEILLCTDSSEFIFKSKNGEEVSDTLQNGLNGENNEIIKRIKFAKNFMIQYVKSHKNKKK